MSKISIPKKLIIIGFLISPFIGCSEEGANDPNNAVVQYFIEVNTVDASGSVVGNALVKLDFERFFFGKWLYWGNNFTTAQNGVGNWSSSPERYRRGDHIWVNTSASKVINNRNNSSDVHRFLVSGSNDKETFKFTLRLFP